VKVTLSIPLAEGPRAEIDSALALSTRAGFREAEKITKEVIFCLTERSVLFVEILDIRKMIVKISIDKEDEKLILSKLSDRTRVLPPRLVESKGLSRLAKIYLSKVRVTALRRAHILDVEKSLQETFLDRVEQEIAARHPNPLISERGYLLSLLHKDLGWLRKVHPRAQHIYFHEEDEEKAEVAPRGMSEIEECAMTEECSQVASSVELAVYKELEDSPARTKAGQEQQGSIVEGEVETLVVSKKEKKALKKALRKANKADNI
jgi:hypothetical protein